MSLNNNIIFAEEEYFNKMHKINFKLVKVIESKMKNLSFASHNHNNHDLVKRILDIICSARNAIGFELHPIYSEANNSFFKTLSNITKPFFRILIHQNLLNIILDYTGGLEPNIKIFSLEEQKVSDLPSLLGDDNYKFDLIISNLSIHLSNDPNSLFAKYKKILTNEGLFLCSLIGGKSLSHLRYCMLNTDINIYNAGINRIMPMIHENSALLFLTKNNFSISALEIQKIEIRYSKIFSLLNELKKFSYYPIKKNLDFLITKGYLKILESELCVSKKNSKYYPAYFELFMLSGAL